MSLFRLIFAGQIKKAEHKDAGGKPIVEVSICRKNRTKEGQPDAFTWVRVTIWSPAAFQAPKLVKGAFIAGSGEMIARSYEKDGVKGTSIEVSCQSFDIEVSDGNDGQASQPEADGVKRTVVAQTKKAAPAAGGGSDLDVPFAPRGEWE